MKISKIAAFTLLAATGSTLADTESRPYERLAKPFHQHEATPIQHVELGVSDRVSYLRDIKPINQVEEHSHQHEKTSLVKSPVENLADSTCITVTELAATSGTNRINLLQSNTDLSCFEDNIWSITTTDMHNLFNPASIITLANHANTLAQQYDGSSSNGLLNFIIYFRVALWAQWGNSSVIGDYDASVESAISTFLQSFANNANYYNTDETHGYAVKEAMLLMHTKSWRSQFLPTAIGWLDRFDALWGSNMQRLLTQTLTLFYSGRYDDDFIATVESDRALVNALDRFLANNTSLLGEYREYQFNDAANELGRLLGYGNQTYQEAKLKVKHWLDRYSMTGTGSKAWLNLAGQTTYHDNANCDYYGTCNYLTELEAQILPISHNCSDSIRVRAQDVTASQLNEICQDLEAQGVYFHQKLQTNQVPVADDNNTVLEIVIYDSSSEYKSYSGILFDHSTDNGGMYLEGDPAVVGNIPRFLAHEAEWLEEFTVWNLEHEFVHYLDGRFIKYGSFSDGYDFHTVFWAEGLAEYISKKDYNDDAIAKARENTYDFSTVFATDYNDSSAQIYDWTYLGIRYLFEEHQNVVDSLVALLKAGDYQGYDNYLDNTIGTSLNNDFAAWLQTVQSTQTQDGQLSNGETAVISSDGTSQAEYFVNLPANSQNLSIRIFGGSGGDADLYVKHGSAPTTSDWDYRPWRTGHNETVEVASPASGDWFIMVNPYGNQAFNDVNLSVNWEDGGIVPPLPDTCASESPMGGGRFESGVPVCAHASILYMSMWVPEGQSKLTIETEYGDGDADLYHKHDGWPSNSDHQNASTTPNSNKERIVVTNPARGWHYVTLDNQGAGLTIKATLED